MVARKQMYGHAKDNAGYGSSGCSHPSPISAFLLHGVLWDVQVPVLLSCEALGRCLEFIFELYHDN